MILIKTELSEVSWDDFESFGIQGWCWRSTELPVIMVVNGNFLNNSQQYKCIVTQSYFWFIQHYSWNPTLFDRFKILFPIFLINSLQLSFNQAQQWTVSPIGHNPDSYLRITVRSLLHLAFFISSLFDLQGIPYFRPPPSGGSKATSWYLVLGPRGRS